MGKPRQPPAPEEPQAPLWVFVGTVAICWLLAFLILAVELLRDSKNWALLAIAWILLTTPMVGFKGVGGIIRSFLIKSLGGKE